MKFRSYDLDRGEIHYYDFKTFDPTIIGVERDTWGESWSETMQYTCLKDKNGQEIYEGDILRTPNGFVGEVVFGTRTYKTKTDVYECTGWLFKRSKDGHNEFLDSEILEGEVIGNIYETPELL